jgi:predicted transcriptional regulator
MGKKTDSDMFSFRLPRALRKQLDVLVKRKLTDLTTEIVGAIRKELERENLWPPPTKDRKS